MAVLLWCLALNCGSVQGSVGRSESRKESKRPRFPQFRSQIFHFHPENCVDIDEATV
jgi:hypothetical protein